MRARGLRNELRELEPGLIAIRTRPPFAIGQRALLVRTEHGNFLWDCLSHIDDETVREVKAQGGIQAISVSHPLLRVSGGAEPRLATERPAEEA